MKLSELHMECSNCSIIDYCNDYEYTPPCEQPRFSNLDTDTFLKLAESSKYDKNRLLNDVANRILQEVEE